MQLNVGDVVVVKSGVLDPDLDIDIGGWTGRLEEVHDGGTVFIRWDSVTLLEMGLDIAIRCENENLDWELMTLDATEIERAAARDSEDDVYRTANQLKADMAGHPELKLD
jgi:hypothetical protein